jgi:hypothetical protein
VARVLLCARGGAPELASIAGALRERGAEPVVLDSSVFPTGAPVTLAYGRDGFRGRWSREPGELHDITAVWQSLVVGLELPAMAPGVRETCAAASELTVVGLLDSLQVFQLDPFASKARADNKPHQLGIAQRLGLEIPETLVTNDPEAVRAFARRAGPVITKMLVQPAATGPAADGEASVVFTTAMTEADLAELEGLELCPMIFQQQIANQLDVRVTLAGHRVFAAALDRSALDRSALGGGELDWRRQSYAEDVAPSWAPYDLPRPVADRLIALADHFGLDYGAADLIVTPDGRHVFLELNASGAFAFLGAGHAGPIAAAIAELLVEPGTRRVSREAAR